MHDTKAKVLVIVEGARTDVRLMGRLFAIYGIDKSHEIVSYNTNIYTLYRRMFADGNPEDYDIQQVLKATERDENRRAVLDDVYSDILLIFDLDPQDPDFSADHIAEMLSYFCESSDMGRLYINYPMVEAFYHMRSIPDAAYDSYRADLQELRQGRYKERVNRENRDHAYDRFAVTKEESNIVIRQNIEKGHRIVYGNTMVTDLAQLDAGAATLIRDLPDTTIILQRQLDAIMARQFVWVLCTCVYYIYEYNPRLLASEPSAVSSMTREELDAEQHRGKPLSEDPNYESEQSTEDFSGCNIIFLDVDGVLNCMSTTDMIEDYIGIDDAKVQILAQMVQLLDARIVLVSSWKGQWYPYAKDRQDAFATILDHRLAQEGLTISDKTVDRRGAKMRGLGILDWIRRQPGGVGKILILDDETFDYKFCGLRRYLLQTSWADPDGGLTERHIRRLQTMLPELDFVDNGKIDF